MVHRPSPHTHQPHPTVSPIICSVWPLVSHTHSHHGNLRALTIDQNTSECPPPQADANPLVLDAVNSEGKKGFSNSGNEHGRNPSPVKPYCCPPHPRLCYRGSSHPYQQPGWESQPCAYHNSASHHCLSHRGWLRTPL